jgi:hypothetical protein
VLACGCEEGVARSEAGGLHSLGDVEEVVTFGDDESARRSRTRGQDDRNGTPLP